MIECNGRDHDKVDKISDEIYALSPNVILKFNVSLSKISGGKRYYFHNEFEYGSPKYQESNLITIKRSFDYYLSFESAKTSDNGSRMFVRIGIQEFLSLSDALKEVLKWYTDAKYDKLYAFDKTGKLILTSPSPSYAIPKLPMGKSIEFRPTIISKGMANADDEMGIAMDFGDDGTVELTFDKFMGLYYLITSFNMYQSALLLINYIGHPDIGTNRVVMESSSRKKPLVQTPEQETTSIKGRFPKAMKNNISQLEGD